MGEAEARRGLSVCRDQPQSVGVALPAAYEILTCVRRRVGVVRAVAHVAESADGDAHGLVLVCEGHRSASGRSRGRARGRIMGGLGGGGGCGLWMRSERWGCEKHMKSATLRFHVSRPQFNLIEAPPDTESILARVPRLATQSSEHAVG